MGFGTKPDMQCSQCHGWGHHADYCATPDDLVDSEIQCEECDGWGHIGKECGNWGGYNRGYQSQRPEHQPAKDAHARMSTEGMVRREDITLEDLPKKQLKRISAHDKRRRDKEGGGKYAHWGKDGDGKLKVVFK